MPVTQVFAVFLLETVCVTKRIEILIDGDFRFSINATTLNYKIIYIDDVHPFL